MHGRSDESRAAVAGEPSPWVMRFLSGVRPHGRVLDLACGSGRHIAPCLSAGYAVTAVDRDTAAVRRRFEDVPAQALSILDIDLETGRPFPFPPGAFDGVIVANYLWRPILPDIVACVARDGVLIYETFQQGQERLGRPRSPDFLLQPGELLAAMRDRLHVIAYEECRLSGPDRIVQRICAVGRDHGWMSEPPAS